MSLGLAPNAPGLGGTAVNPTNSSFNNAPFVLNTAGKPALEEARKQHAPKADKPTIAAVDPTTKLPDALQQVGSDAQVLPKMMQLLSQIQSMMKMNNSASNQPSSTQPAATITLAGVDQTICTALTDTFSEICDNLSFQIVISTLINTFANDGYYQINPNYEATVSQAVLQLILNSSTNSVANLAYFVIPPANILANTYVANTKANVIINTSVSNIPSPVVSSIPQYYVQQFQPIAIDPYPGYVEWLGSAGDYVYTIRTSDQPNYSTIDDSVLGQSEILLYNNLYPYFLNQSLSADNLNSILDLLYPATTAAATESVLGSGSSSNILSSLLGILGPIGSLIQQANSVHLPASVLDQGAMANTLQSFTKNIGALQQMKNLSNSAFSSSSILDQLGSLGNFNISSITSMLPSSVTSIFQQLPSGALSPSAITSLISSGVSSASATNISNIAQNNSEVTSNTISTIASVTANLEASNTFPQDQISNIQLLLSEVIKS